MRVVEIVTFSLRDGVAAQDFADVDATVGREYVSQQPGFVSRETAHDGQDWLVIVHWQDEGSAERSMERYEQAPAAQRQMSLMQHGTMRMSRYTLV